MTNDELDRAVAIEVMGMTPSCSHGTGDPDCGGYGCIWLVGGTETEELLYIREGYVESGYVFSPSTCWRSAGAVVERLREGGMWIELCWDDEGVRLTAYSPAPGTGGAWTFGGGDPSDPILRRLAFAALAATRAGALEGKP